MIQSDNNRSSAREGLKSIKKSSEKIKQDYSVAIFPEGTRSKRGNIVVQNYSNMR